MKSILMIGMGKFGHHLCQNLVDLGNEVMIVDTNQAVMEDLIPFVTSAKIGDCTSPDVLKSLGVGNFDLCFVCIGTNFQSSLEITSQLKDMGAKYVVSKANRDIHGGQRRTGQVPFAQRGGRGDLSRQGYRGEGCHEVQR